MEEYRIKADTFKRQFGSYPTDEIRTLLGHTDAQTTLGYIYNFKCFHYKKEIASKSYVK